VKKIGMLSGGKAIRCAAGLCVILLFVNHVYAGNKSKVRTVEKSRIMSPVDVFHPKTYVCYRASKPFKIDGKLNEQAWQHAEWTDDFQDIEGGKQPVPHYRTRAKMLWDDNFLYVAAEIEEPDVWANITQRDAVIFHDNDFEVFIDPNGDTHNYTEYEMNALNTVWDLLLEQPYRDHNFVLNNYDLKGLISAVSVDGTLNNSSDKDRKWTVEIAFPLSAYAELKAKPADGVQWRVNFSRVEWQIEKVDGQYQKKINPATGLPYPEDNWVWSPQGVVNMHLPEMWGFVQFSDIPSGKEKTSFKWNRDEEVKWALRQVYYAQRRYVSTNRRYASDVNQLADLKEVPGSFDVKIYTTPEMYEAIIQSPFSGKTWHINQEGRTWCDK
jgi:hypothetical protein